MALYSTVHSWNRDSSAPRSPVVGKPCSFSQQTHLQAHSQQALQLARWYQAVIRLDDALHLRPAVSSYAAHLHSQLVLRAARPREHLPPVSLLIDLRRWTAPSNMAIHGRYSDPRITNRAVRLSCHQNCKKPTHSPRPTRPPRYPSPPNSPHWQYDLPSGNHSAAASSATEQPGSAASDLSSRAGPPPKHQSFPPARDFGGWSLLSLVRGRTGISSSRQGRSGCTGVSGADRSADEKGWLEYSRPSRTSDRTQWILAPCNILYILGRGGRGLVFAVLDRMLGRVGARPVVGGGGRRPFEIVDTRLLICACRLGCGVM